jgi:hypothetical protein
MCLSWKTFQEVLEGVLEETSEWNDPYNLDECSLLQVRNARMLAWEHTDPDATLCANMPTLPSFLR